MLTKQRKKASNECKSANFLFMQPYSVTTHDSQTRASWKQDDVFSQTHRFMWYGCILVVIIVHVLSLLLCMVFTVFIPKVVFLEHSALLTSARQRKWQTGNFLLWCELYFLALSQMLEHMVCADVCVFAFPQHRQTLVQTIYIVCLSSIYPYSDINVYEGCMARYRPHQPSSKQTPCACFTQCLFAQLSTRPVSDNIYGSLGSAFIFWGDRLGKIYKRPSLNAGRASRPEELLSCERHSVARPQFTSWLCLRVSLLRFVSLVFDFVACLLGTHLIA